MPGAAEVLAEAGVPHRAEIVDGDYLRAVPAQGEPLRASQPGMSLLA